MLSCSGDRKCHSNQDEEFYCRNYYTMDCQPVFFDFSLTVKAAPHECVIRTGQL